MFLPEKSVEKKGELVEAILQLVSSLSIEERKEVLDHLQQKSGGIPISIFRSSISGLEAIVVYLKDVKGLSVGKISELLNRKKSTIYTTYHKAKQKLTGEFDYSDTSLVIPYRFFADRKFAVLESLVAYLKDELKLPFVKISALLNKKYSTVRTVYVRYKKKCS
ncbi:MAG: sigma factor-like helix-turn-helix DNA-binding protein [Nanoarchaeota archaeon]